MPVKVVPRSLTEAYKRREGDFAPNLVGLQFTDGFSLFTFGNFQITANLDARLNKNFAFGGQWSDYYSLDNLNLTEQVSQTLLSNEIFVRLNFDPNNISRYVYFGSFYDFVKVSLENIIKKWKGSVYLNPKGGNSNTIVNTVLSFNYNAGNDTATFLIPKSVVSNNFQLNLDQNTDFFDIPVDEIYNVQRDYRKYVIWKGGDTEYPVIGYTGATTSYPYLNVITKGNPFPSISATTFGQIEYHLKPNSLEVQLFFEELSDFEKILLNRLTNPIYKCSFEVPKEVDGIKFVTTENFIWPVSDGYNLDIFTRQYTDYLNKLLGAALNFDANKTDLISRRFVSESIQEFDTRGQTLGDETFGRKVSKLLKIYGREFDEVKKYIDGISFANVVTYNKLDNTSDELIKIMAKNLGFDVLLTVGTDNFNLLEQMKPALTTPFSGYSRSLSTMELDIELWRRLVINAWWLFKSKGTRKVIEFFFNLFKIPQCMVTLNEYVYLAENTLNPTRAFFEMRDLLQIVDENAGGGGVSTLSEDLNFEDLPMDDFGFPRILPDNEIYYFQNDGFWYNGGNDSTIGNNPHIGSYDFGQKYFNQFKCFYNIFSQDGLNDLLTGFTNVIVNKNYFNNYNKGTFIFDQNGLPVPYYGTSYANFLNTNNLVQNATVNTAGLTDVGNSTGAPSYSVPSGDTFSLKISFTAGNKELCTKPCDYRLLYGDDGIVYIDGNPKKPLTDQKCCQNYWLPVPVSTGRPTCPNTANLVITTNGTVIEQSTGKSVTKDCCSKNILGFNVLWTGTECIQSTTKVISDSIDTLNNTNKILGNYTDLGPNQVLAAVSTNPVDQPINKYYCYWCPPKTNIVCNIDQYFSLLTQQQIIQLATSYGWSEDTVALTPIQFLTPIYNTFFIKYGCLYLDTNNQQITNQKCCQVQGGTWTALGNADNPSYACVKPNATSCKDTAILNLDFHMYFDTKNQLITKDCCIESGHEFSNNGYITVYTNGVQSPNSYLDTIPINYFNNIGINLTANTNPSVGYCTDCPLSVNINSATSVVTSYPSGGNLTRKCCIDYGLNYDSINNVCKLPTLVNPIDTNVGTPTELCPTSVWLTLNTLGVIKNQVILDQSQKSLTENCCQQAGGYYGYFGPTNTTGAYVNTFGVVSNPQIPVPPALLQTTYSVPQTAQNAKICFSCPPKTDPGYGFISSFNPITLNTKTEVVYNGVSLPYRCCDYYVGGLPLFSFSAGPKYVNGKCYTNY